MRLKLVVAASLLASIVGAGSTIAILLATFSSLKPIQAPGLLVGATFAIPTAAIVLASMFVYRHTARRRKLQAALTSIISVVLTLSLFFAATIITSRWNPNEPPQQTTPHIAS